MKNEIIGVFGVCNTGGICVHAIDHAEVVNPVCLDFCDSLLCDVLVHGFVPPVFRLGCLLSLCVYCRRNTRLSSQLWAINVPKISWNKFDGAGSLEGTVTEVPADHLIVEADGRKDELIYFEEEELEMMGAPDRVYYEWDRDYGDEEEIERGDPLPHLQEGVVQAAEDDGRGGRSRR